MDKFPSWSRTLIALLGLGIGAMPVVAAAHPMGNFSISHYAGITVDPRRVELRYLIDMAEIPTFQEIQDSAIVPEDGHPSLDRYLARKADILKEGLALEVNGRRLVLQKESSSVLFSPGAGELPTMKLGIVYGASLADALSAGLNRLVYRDGNFPDRAGWKEVVVQPAPGIVLASSSAPRQDRSRQLTDYPTDLLASPPQTLQAWLTFASEAPAAVSAAVGSPEPPVAPTALEAAPGTSRAPTIPEPDDLGGGVLPPPVTSEVAGARRVPPGARAVRPVDDQPLALQPNRQGTRRDPFTDLISSTPAGAGIVLFAALVAATLGAFHALEPGHGKTVVAAYLVGSRGTARHAMLLGLIVTASHTAGVYLLGGVTLYASRYVLPERLYPWLGALSGLTIAGLGFFLFLERCAGWNRHHDHDHGHGHGSADYEHSPAHHDHHHGRHDHHHHHPAPDGTVSLRELLALGVTGGIVPCPAALVVLLSAVALRRVGFGLFLIVAFSVGLAAVLIAIGLLMVYARRLMARVQGDGPLITRWLPLTSSAVITVLGVGIAAQALTSAGILTIRPG